MGIFPGIQIGVLMGPNVGIQVRRILVIGTADIVLLTTGSVAPLGSVKKIRGVTAREVFTTTITITKVIGITITVIIIMSIVSIWLHGEILVRMVKAKTSSLTFVC